MRETDLPQRHSVETLHSQFLQPLHVCNLTLYHK